MVGMGKSDEGFHPRRAVVVGAVESTAIAVEEISARKEWTVPMVVTLPARLSTRHSDFVDLSPHAEKAGARLFETERTNEPDVIEEIAATRPDYIFVIGWSQICGPAFLGIRPGKTVGYHPAPIPRLRGRAAIPWTILLGEPISASTLFWVDERADSGPILAQEYFHVGAGETAQSLYDKHMACLRRMLRESLVQLAEGIERRRPQDEAYATWATKRTPADGRIDWTQSDRDIDRLVRAVGRPYPGAFTAHCGRTLHVWRASPTAGGELHHAMPGQIVYRDGESLVVKTGTGLLRLDEWELEGGGTPPMHSVLGERQA